MQKWIFVVMIIFAVSVFIAGTFNEALAACTSPDAQEGALNQSGGDWFKCDGSSWVPFGGGGGFSYQDFTNPQFGGNPIALTESAVSQFCISQGFDLGSYIDHSSSFTTVADYQNSGWITRTAQRALSVRCF